MQSPESQDQLLATSSERLLSSSLEALLKIQKLLDSVLACLLDQKSLALLTVDKLTQLGQVEEEDS